MSVLEARSSIVELLESLGVTVRGHGPKRQVRCPLPGHADSRASAVLFLETDRFHCSVCTPGRAITRAELVRALGVTSSPVSCRARQTEGRVKTPARTATFTRADACEVWRLASARARDDQAADTAEDGEVYRYVASRGLMEAWERGAFGVLPASVELPVPIQSWPERGYRLVAPLRDVVTGEIVNVQARCVLPGSEPKTLLPRGSVSRGTAFMTTEGMRVLRDGLSGVPVVIAEGLTDHLTLAIHCHVPVLSAPGAGVAVHLLGAWVRDREIIIALDRDRAGDAAAAQVAARAHLLGAHRVHRAYWPAPAKDACDALSMLGSQQFESILHGWTERKAR